MRRGYILQAFLESRPSLQGMVPWSTWLAKMKIHLLEARPINRDKSDNNAMPTELNVT
jgi:hypothetical protein